MVWAFDDTMRNNRLDQVTADIDAGGAAGSIRLYDGTQPAKGGAATTLLAEGTFSFPSFPAASGGTMSANAITGDASANATGTATWGRIVDSTGAFVMDGTVGAVGSGADIEIDNTNIAAGQAVNFNSFTLTEGNA